MRDFRIAPTAVIDAGHISLNSKTNGILLTADNANPPIAVKNCGEVATSQVFLKQTSANAAIIKA